LRGPGLCGTSEYILLFAHSSRNAFDRDCDLRKAFAEAAKLFIEIITILNGEIVSPFEFDDILSRDHLAYGDVMFFREPDGVGQKTIKVCLLRFTFLLIA
jgi:hypothetical protein